MKKIIFSGFIFAAALFFSVPAAMAQIDSRLEAEFDKNLALMRKDLRSGKKQLIAANMTLTDVEATKFWTVYDQYAAEVARIYDDRVAIIKEYAANQQKMTDSVAANLVKRSIENEAATTKLKQKYYPMFEKVIPGKKSALFFQLDKRLGLLIDLQVASEIPLVTQ